MSPTLQNSIEKPYWNSWNSSQKRVYDEALELYGKYAAARGDLTTLPGWMFWKRYPNGREYLVHAYDRQGRGTTLGSRSDTTESRLLEFKTRQIEAKLRTKVARDALLAHSRFVKAARMNRLPRSLSTVLRALEERIPNATFIVVSSHALHAYEMAMGGMFSPQVLQSHPIALLIHHKQPDDANEAEHDVALRDKLLSAARSVDPTFVWRHTDTSIMESARGETFAFADMNQGSAIHKLPTADVVLQLGFITQVAFDWDGMPFAITAPDPFVYVEWMQSNDRRPKFDVPGDAASALSHALGEMGSQPSLIALPAPALS